MATADAGSVTSLSPAEVVLVLRARRRPGARAEGAKLTLAIIGGGMRGVVSAGMDLGMVDAFDEVYAASAGPFSAGYLSSRLARVGATIYCEAVNKRHFIDLRRTFRKPVFDLDSMLDLACDLWLLLVRAPLLAGCRVRLSVSLAGGA